MSEKCYRGPEYNVITNFFDKQLKEKESKLPDRTANDEAEDQVDDEKSGKKKRKKKRKNKRNQNQDGDREDNSNVKSCEGTTKIVILFFAIGQ